MGHNNWDNNRNLRKPTILKAAILFLGGFISLHSFFRDFSGSSLHALTVDIKGEFLFPITEQCLGG